MLRMMNGSFVVLSSDVLSLPEGIAGGVGFLEHAVEERLMILCWQERGPGRPSGGPSKHLHLHLHTPPGRTSKPESQLHSAGVLYNLQKPAQYVRMACGTPATGSSCVQAGFLYLILNALLRVAFARY